MTQNTCVSCVADNAPRAVCASLLDANVHGRFAAEPSEKSSCENTLGVGEGLAVGDALVGFPPPFEGEVDGDGEAAGAFAGAARQ